MNSLTASPVAPLFPTIGKLLLLRLRISWNSFKHARTRNKVFTILAAIGFLFFAGGIFVLSWLLLDFLHSPQLLQYAGDVTSFLEMVLVLILTALFLGILLSSFGVLLQALYLSGDMDFLLAAPVPMRAVFVAKLLQAVLPNFGLISLFGLPVLYGLGMSGGYNLSFFILVPLVMAFLALAAAGLSSLLVMFAARYFPARRVAEVLAFVTAILAFTCSQSGNFFNAFGQDVDVSSQQVNAFFSLLRGANVPWLPLNWAGRGLVALGSGDWLAGVPLTALTLLLCAVVFMFSLATAERWYYRGWASLQVVAGRKKPPKRSIASELERSRRIPVLARFLPSPVQAVMNKDFMVMRRDLRNLSQLITPLIFGVIYSLIFLRQGGEPPPGQGEAPAIFIEALRSMMTYGSIGMSLFVGWMLLGRLSGLAFSSEGRYYWILKASPVQVRHLLAAKYLIAYLPALVLGLLFLTVIALLQKLPIADFLYSLVASALCLAGMNGILLGFGVAGANFHWDDPRKMSAGGLGCLGQFLTMLFLPLSFGLFVGPVVLFPLLELSPALGYLSGLALGSVLSLTAAILPLQLVRKKVERLDEG